MIKWARTGGYECSSKGDKRFSAFTAKMTYLEDQLKRGWIEEKPCATASVDSWRELVS